MKHFRQYIYEQHKMDEKELKNIVEAILLSSNEPISLERLLEVFDEWQRPTKEHLGIIINDLKRTLYLDHLRLFRLQLALSYRLEKIQ